MPLRYGDYLYSQGNYDEAIAEYIKTIGVFEPSYVIRKFLDAQRLPCLTTYLEALHNQGLANTQHTTLLINCYCKMHQRDKLKEFIYTDSRGRSLAALSLAENRFDVATAIRVLTDCGWEKEALHLSRKYAYHHDYLRLLIEYERDFQTAVDYIHSLSFHDAEAMIQEFGRVLLDEVPQPTTQLCIELCTDYQQASVPPVSSPLPAQETPLSPLQSLRLSLQQSFNSKRAAKSALAAAAPALLASLSGSALDPKFGNPSSYIHLFASHSDRLDEFLSEVVRRPQPCDASTWNALLELALRKEAEQSAAASAAASEVVVQRSSRVMEILTDPRAAYDEEEALVLVQTYNSAEGQVYLYKKLGMYSLLLQHYLQHNDSQNCIAVCKAYGEQNGDLWIQLLTMLAQQSQLNLALIHEILDYVEKTNVVPLLTALQIVSQNDKIKLGMVKQFVIRQVRRRRGAVQTVERGRLFPCRTARRSATS